MLTNFSGKVFDLALLWSRQDGDGKISTGEIIEKLEEQEREMGELEAELIMQSVGGLLFNCFAFVCTRVWQSLYATASFLNDYSKEQKINRIQKKYHETLKKKNHQVKQMKKRFKI